MSQLKKLIPLPVKRFLRKIQFHLLKMLTSEDDSYWTATRSPYVELKKFIENDSPLIIDGGANKGNTVDIFLQHLPSAKIHAFEPIPELVTALEKTYHNTASVEIHAQALGAENKDISFSVNVSQATSSVFQTSDFAYTNYGDIVHQEKEITVPMVRLDSIFQQSIDVLKLDLQGYELEALKGCGDLLGKVRVILTEIEFVPLYSNQPLFHDVDKFLQEAGFWLYNLYNLTPVPSGRLAFGDAIYLNSQYFNHQ